MEGEGVSGEGRMIPDPPSRSRSTLYGHRNSRFDSGLEGCVQVVDEDHDEAVRAGSNPGLQGVEVPPRLAW